MSLRQRAFRAMIWAGIAGQSARAISYLTQLVLAGLLAPEAFGVVGIVMVVLNSMQIFQDIGLGRTLIARRGDVDRAASVALVITAGTGLLLCGLLALVSPWIASFFNYPSVGPLLRLISVRLVFTSLGTVPTALLQKDLRFKTLAWPKLIGSVAFAGVALPMALLASGPASIVWGSIAQAILETVAAWLLLGRVPRIEFDPKLALELVKYSWHLVAVSFGIFLQHNLDGLTIGRILGPTSLGYYNLGWNLGNALPGSLLGMLSPILLPTYAQIQDQPERMANVHLRMVKFVTLLITGATLLVGVLAPDLILSLYGETWRASIVPAQILCVYTLVVQVAGTNSPVLILNDKLREWNAIVYANIGLFLLIVLPAAHFAGLLGVSIAMLVAGFCSCVPAFIVSSRSLGTPLQSYGALALKPFGAALTAVIASCILRAAVGRSVVAGPENLLANVGLMVAQGLVVSISYVAIALATDRELRGEVHHLLLQVLRVRSWRALSQE